MPKRTSTLLVVWELTYAFQLQMSSFLGCTRENVSPELTWKCTKGAEQEGAEQEGAEQEGAEQEGTEQEGAVGLQTTIGKKSSL